MPLSHKSDSVPLMQAEVCRKAAADTGLRWYSVLSKGSMLALLLFYSPVAEAGKIDAIKTEGGQTAWMSHDASLPLFAFRLSFDRSGTAYDPKGKEGLAVFAARMMTEGAGDLSSRAFHETLENKAIDLDVKANEDRLILSLDGLSEHRAEAFDLLGKVLRSPRIEAADVERIRKELLSELKQMEEDPNYMAGRAFDKIAFKDHPYSLPGHGTRKTIAAITAEDLKSYLATHVAKAGITASLSGDISQKEAVALLSSTLDGLPEGKKTSSVPETELRASGMNRVYYQVPQTVVGFALPGIRRDDPEFYAAYLMNYSLGGGTLTARLGEEIRRKRGLSYYVTTYLDVDEASHLWRGGMAVRNDKADQAIDVLKQTIEETRKKPFTDEEVKAAKDYVIGSFPMSIDTNREFAGYMQMMQWFDLGIQYIDQRSDYFRKVTTKDVNEAAKRLLDPKKLLVVAIGGNKNHGETNEPSKLEKN